MKYGLELLKADIEDELDWERERLVARKFPREIAMLRNQVEEFLVLLAAMDEE